MTAPDRAAVSSTLPEATFTSDQVAGSNGTPDGFNATTDKIQAPDNPLTTGRFQAGGQQCKPATAQEGSQRYGSPRWYLSAGTTTASPLVV